MEVQKVCWNFCIPLSYFILSLLLSGTVPVTIGLLIYQLTKVIELRHPAYKVT
jgi:hypothetical protein